MKKYGFLVLLAVMGCGRGHPDYVAQDWYDVEYLESGDFAVAFQSVKMGTPINLILHPAPDLVVAGTVAPDWTVYKAEMAGQKSADPGVDDLLRDPFLLWFKDKEFHAAHIPHVLNDEGGSMFLTGIKRGEKGEPIAVYGKDANGKEIKRPYTEAVMRGLTPVRSLKGYSVPKASK